MTYHRPDLPRSGGNLIWYILLGLLLYAVSILVPRSCKGEMIFSSGFKGIATDVQPQALDWQQARKSVGWLYLDGHLERETFELRGTLPAYPLGLTWLGYYSQNNQIIFYDAELRKYSIDGDTSMAVSDAVNDSVITTASDSSVTQLMASSRWLNLALTDRGINNTVIINGVLYTVIHFYSDSVLHLAKGYAGSTASDVPFRVGGSIILNTDHVGSLETDDTTWVFDGNIIFPYTDSLTVSFSFPVYSDSGTFDSIMVNPTDGDSVFVFDSRFKDAHVGKYFLWNDSLPSRRAIPVYIADVDTASGAPYALLYCDSASHAGQNHFGNLKRFLIADLVVDYDTTLSKARCDLDSIGTYGNMKFFRLSVSDPPDRWKTGRSLDGRVYRIRPVTDGIDDYAWKHFFVKQSSYDATNDSAVFFLWGNIASTLTNNNYYQVTRSRTVDIETSGDADDWPYALGALHRRRAWWSGNDTGVTIWAWSDQAHDDTIVGAEELEGISAITSLISTGQEITAIRENQSVLRGPVAGAQLDNSETITGFSEDDFYKTPIGAILSGNFTISPLGLGMFSGGAIQPIETDCNSVFSDSINWAAGDRIVAAIYQDRVWLGLPFGTATTNNRCLVVDPSTQPVTIGFVGAVKPGSFLVRRDAETDEQLYIGQADTNYLWLAGATADRYEIADWRSGWFDGGDLSARKLVREYVIDLTGTTGDSVWVDFYTDFSETAKWSDTIVVTSTGPRTVYAAVNRAVQGYAVAYGIRSPDAVAITGFGWDVVAAGKVRKQ